MTALIGYGAHGHDIEAIWEHAHPTSKLKLYDDDKRAVERVPAILGSVLIGVNDPSTRRKIAIRYPNTARALIDPLAVIGPRVRVGRGCIIAPRAVLLCEVRLAPHVHVNYGATMTRTSIGACTTVSPGVTICGDVSIGEECLIGAGATICDRVVIGDRVIIAAGAIVPPLSVVPEDTKVIGVWKQ